MSWFLNEYFIEIFLKKYSENGEQFPLSEMITNIYAKYIISTS